MSRAVKSIPVEQLPSLSTQRLLAYRDRLLGLEDNVAGSDMDAQEVAGLDPSLLHFKEDLRWSVLYEAVKRELDAREHVEGTP